MPKDRIRSQGEILRFPGVEVQTHTSSSESKRSSTDPRPETHSQRDGQIDVVLCGTLRKDTEGLTRAREQLKELGCRILELRHLGTIHQARFVWLHAPRGYVGPTTALEIGFARASGVPTFSVERPKDAVLQHLVRVVASPEEVILNFLRDPADPIDEAY